MTEITRTTRVWLVAAAVCTAAVGGCGKGVVLDHKHVTLDALIDALRGVPRPDRPMVEATVGAPLSKISENGAFTFYEARNVILQDTTIGVVDYREPKPGGGATAGALLTMSVTKGCPTRAQIEHRYGPLAITDVPRGRSLDEETQLTRRERWGRMSFGFAERSPTCLSSVTFNHEQPG